ncbi:eukaryotic translation initiation factor 3 subunit A [Pichia californica]|uniref:Eukaryotic translation initiation factor 3 subunit A n=1 Tax=Pichia californica TaxID=460514 RepID=A0A9P7BI56_9ASCO|nr:eukaryotic translation initiation factor 3 subunit A [[Candida] californica]KAG0691009.1 eukaryotic translation initiation factor 3 subunit A [[Candida] californica]
MSYQAGRPENVLRRAEDLININQPDVALQNLYAFITSKRTKSIEPTNPQLLEIFKLFISLAIDSRLSKDIKDALYQYKKMIQALNTAVGYESLEQLTKYFLTTANSKLDEAQSKANSAAEVAIEKSVASAAAAQKIIGSGDMDVDVDETDDVEDDEAFTFNLSPEDILLSSVTTDDTTDRSNKEFFLPWLRFAWESYRTVLELLRGSNKLENSYCQVTLQSFQFCVKYERKSEFKRLCEILKTHLLSMSKEYEDSVNLSNPDTLQKFLDTRFQQLNTAVELELWKESFKSIEDVHGLMKYSKRTPKPISMINYFNNLAKIFQVSNNYVYATAARQKLFQLLIQSPVITDTELKENASIHLISSLSIPILETIDDSFSSQNGLVDAEFFKRKNNKLTSLLNLNETPSRESLLNSATLKTVLKYADVKIVELYNLLEKNFNPLSFHSSADKILNEIANSDKYAPFAEPLKKVIISKVLSKVSTLYESIKFDFLYKLCNFSNNLFNYDEFTFEDLIINGQFSGLLKVDVELDEESGVINFIDKLYVTPGYKVNSRLFDLARSLSNAIGLINIEETKELEKERQFKLLKAARDGFEEEKKNILQTANIIKERESALSNEKRDEQLRAEKEKAEDLLRYKRSEEERIAQDNERREQEKREKTQKRILMENKKALIKDINAKGVINIKYEDVKDMSEDDIRQLQIDKLESESKKLEEQTDAIFKRADYIERAQRQYEIPLLEKEITKDVSKQKAEYDLLKEKKMDQAKKTHEQELKVKERLSRFVPVFEEYTKKLDDLSSDVVKIQQKKAEEAFEEAKNARIAEFIAAKKREFLENARREAEKVAAKEAEEKAREAELHAREEKAKAREEAFKAEEQRRMAADPERMLYEELKNKAGISMSEKMKLRRLAAKYEN